MKKALIIIMLFCATLTHAQIRPVFTDGTHLYSTTSTTELENVVMTVQLSPTSSNSPASREYVDNLASLSRTFYFWGNTKSDLDAVGEFTNFYFMSDGAASTNTEQTHTYSSVTNNEYLSIFCTTSGVPGITEIQAGTYTVVAYMAKSGAKAVTVKAEGYLLDQNGAFKFELEDVAGQLLSTIKDRHTWDIVLPTNVTQLVTDRWAVKFKVVSQTGPPNPDVIIYTEGSSHGFMTAQSGGEITETDPVFEMWLGTNTLLDSAGGTMSGAIAMESNKITSLSAISFAAAEPDLATMTLSRDFANPRLILADQSSQVVCDHADGDVQIWRGASKEMSVSGSGMMLSTGGRVDNIETNVTADHTHMATSGGIHDLIDADIATLKEADTSWTGTNTYTKRVGIGTNAPESDLHVTAGNSGMAPQGHTQVFVESDSNSGIQFGSGTSASAYLEFGDSGDQDIGKIQYDHFSNTLKFRANNIVGGWWEADGDLNFNGHDPVNTSDARLKTNMVYLTNVTAKVKAIQAIVYEFKNDLGVERLGFTAQNIELIFPQCVNVDHKGNKGLKSMMLIPPLYEAFDELEKRVTAAEVLIISQQAAIVALEKRVAELEK